MQNAPCSSSFSSSSGSELLAITGMVESPQPSMRIGAMRAVLMPDLDRASRTHMQPCIILKRCVTSRHASQGRDHQEFVCRLRDYMPTRSALLEAFPQALHAAGFQLQVHRLLIWCSCRHHVRRS